jgi:hypothetical protein
MGLSGSHTHTQWGGEAVESAFGFAFYMPFQHTHVFLSQNIHWQLKLMNNS